MRRAQWGVLWQSVVMFSVPAAALGALGAMGAILRVLSGRADIFKTEYGGDPDRVFYGGHSAGGHLAALVALSRDRLRARGLPDDAIKGCLPVSGIFDLRMQSAVPGGVTELVHPLVFADPEDSESYSPVTCADGNSTPFFVAYGEADLPEVVSTSRAFIACLDHAPCVIEHHMWPGSNHYETSEDLADPDNAWVRKLGAWMMAPPRRGDAHP